MTDETKKDVASVEAPLKKQYQKREPIYDVRFSFTDSNMIRAKIRKNKKTKLFPFCKLIYGL